MIILFDRNRNYEQTVRLLRSCREQVETEQAWAILSGAICHQLADWSKHLCATAPARDSSHGVVTAGGRDA